MCISPLGASEGGNRGTGNGKRVKEKRRGGGGEAKGAGGERTSADKDGYGGGDGGGGSGGGVKESRREKEYIAVIIAIDFYRQTITPGVLLTVTLDVPAMLFFSFSFPSAPSTPGPPFSRPRPPSVSPTLVPDASRVAINSFFFQLHSIYTLYLSLSPLPRPALPRSC